MKLLGIVGGAGPEASNKFCELLVRHKSRVKDQDNVPFIHFCNPAIPDRTAFIVGDGEDPVPELVHTCNKLSGAGADFLVIPCNTAHVYLKRVQEEVSVPILDMTKILVKKIIEGSPMIKKVGVLATTGSIKSRLFEDYLEMVGVESILLNDFDHEHLMMDAVYGVDGIKSGKKRHAKELLSLAVHKLIEKGAQAVILGCTEIPLVLSQKDFDIKLYDPMDIVAREILSYLETSMEDKIVTIKTEITGGGFV